MTNRIRGTSRVALGAVLIAGLASLALTSEGANAQISVCRTDPLVKLSNGKTLKLVASIYDASANVSSVTYTLKIPSTVYVTGETFTGGAFASKETLTIYATNPANTYTTTYLVSDSKTNINVTGQATLTSGPKTVASGGYTGFANQAFDVEVTG